ncbi:DUF421 domain-containing protein [Sphingobacterium hotanense]|uniref:DUF421 domain-containing protein n=1 Tax=Sphingobacterium hotanense TaxID=649196 RepID=UPI0011F22164|nr:YetF domain-containing protein [Sphingobacterium hotanense]
MIDIQNIFLKDVELSFILEIISRTLMMFLIILIVLRLSGRRGVRQLTLFEVAIILAMGSAAGDPMFQEDIPILYGFIVLFSIILFYKFITWLTQKNRFFNELMEGKPMCVVKNGMFEVKKESDSDFSQMEFFAELRNQSIEHLGQVRVALLEVDGTMSVLYYPDEEVKYGLPLFPDDQYKITSLEDGGPFACLFCGNVKSTLETCEDRCDRCGKREWAHAINSRRIG